MTSVACQQRHATSGPTRLGEEAQALFALYEYGALHGGVRVRRRPGERLLPVAWSLRGDPDFTSLVSASIRHWVPLEMVVGLPAGFADPWLAAITASVVERDREMLFVREGEDVRADERLNLSCYWQQDDQFILRANLKKGTIFFEITDKTGAVYSFRERSSGLRYFLSYYIQAKAIERGGDKHGIVLMDEPDSFLSVVGQRNLLSVFESLVSPDSSCKLRLRSSESFRRSMARIAGLWASTRERGDVSWLSAEYHRSPAGHGMNGTIRMCPSPLES